MDALSGETSSSSDKNDTAALDQTSEALENNKDSATDKDGSSVDASTVSLDSGSNVKQEKVDTDFDSSQPSKDSNNIIDDDDASTLSSSRKRKLNESDIPMQQQKHKDGAIPVDPAATGLDTNSNDSAAVDDVDETDHLTINATLSSDSYDIDTQSTKVSEHDANADESPTSTNAEKSAEHTASTAKATKSHANTTVQQPEGWRVKLYRLNVDGGWDDCGTGRIVCLYRNGDTKSSAKDVGNASTGNESARNSAEDGETAPESLPPHRVVGSDAWLYHETGEATLSVNSELSAQQRQPRVLLRTRVLLRDAYQRQGDNIITWCEPYYNSGRHPRGSSTSPPSSSNTNSGGGNSNASGVDLALSFQDNAGCLNIWNQITHVQSRADELLRQHQPTPSAKDMAAQVASQHHADLEQQHYEEQQQHDMWSHSGGSDNVMVHNTDDMIHGRSGNIASSVPMGPSLPQTPTLENLEEVADTIVAIQHAHHRENLVAYISKDDCAYLKDLLALFPEAEDQGDYSKLATLSACIKTILLMNDPFTLDLIVSVSSIFEQVCSSLEYDPDLREKANHRWFLRERAKFRTVVPMEDPELVSAIHRSFRVSYIRDTLLRPTMDEASLSTLSSIQTFIHAEIVKGVAIPEENQFALNNNSYLVRVIRMLGLELHYIGITEWFEIESQVNDTSPHISPPAIIDEFQPDDTSVVVGKHQSMDQSSTDPTTTWKQYLAPQDSSLRSRKIRRRGCISFLRELFNMVRLSLQQRDKEDFFLAICGLDVDLLDDREIPDNTSQTSQTVEVGSVASTVRSDRLDDKNDAQSHELPTPASPVTLLSLFGHILSDSTADVSEKAAVLEIISSMALHDPALIRRHILACHDGMHQDRQKVDANGKCFVARPDPNGRKQVLFLCPPSDLLASLICVLNSETDAGLLLQVTEIMRIILDSDIVSDHGPTNSFADEAEPPSSGSLHSPPHDQHNEPSGTGATSTEQKQFLSLFYEHYVEWLVAPFLFTIFLPVRRVPESAQMRPAESPLLSRMTTIIQQGTPQYSSLLRKVPPCSIRGSFAVELFSFCVRAHLYRMKFFLLKSQVLGNVLKVLRPCSPSYLHTTSGERCLKLAALRFLRAILSVNDEFYHRHIIQNNLFVPVFDALRANPIGDNLVSSAIVEMCDYVHNQNINSLLEYIVTRHLTSDDQTLPSLEQVSSPYVSTLTMLRKAYESRTTTQQQQQQHVHNNLQSESNDRSKFFGSKETQLSGKALEDQQKYNAMDAEEAYFASDDNEEEVTSNPVVEDDKQESTKA